MQLHVRTWGDATAPKTAVLLHGITSNADSWARVAPALVERGYHCVAPDLRGHGQSPHPASGYALADLVADLAESVPTAPDLLVGHSLGGVLALLATCDGVLRPRLLVLEDPAVAVHAEGAHRIVAAGEAGPHDLAAIIAANPRWDPVDAEAKAAAFATLDWDHMRQIAVGNAPWDHRPRAAELVTLGIPTLYVLAEPSELVPPADAQQLQALLGEQAVVAVAGAGHSVHRDDLPGFLAALFAWLDAVEPRPASAASA